MVQDTAPSPNAAAPRTLRLRLRAVVDETADARSLVFEVPPGQAEALRYRPGQFLTLRLPVDGRVLPRCYSMSSSPGLDEGLRVTVKRVACGRGSNWICDQLRAGDEVEVLPPAGVFTPRSLDGDFLLLAGGSGITPVFSILRSVLAQGQGQGRILLVYANRDERSVIFREALAALAGAHPARLQVIHWLDSVQGRPSVAQLAELVRALPQQQPQAQAFICGPAPFMDAAVAALQAIAMAPERIHVERFASLPEEPAAGDASATPPTPTPAATPAVDEAEVELLLDGQTHRLRCAGHETLLQAALRAGIAVPHSCQAGLCAACMCQVKDGSVHLRHNEALDQKDLAKSWTLACQALPTSPRLRVQFPG
ncbi:MAG TPA: ferredoxin--NADP reductase [Burkholderiaceae bacterium]|nr:ferredoxin--NADP reductase [Burkholderiaceae bacterium]HNB46993.1 ferredoxin--NADP reductase [Burkholderiaceae bacterium]HNG82529.1 ferredoxin--NADP reductase [Burkholderiaceae bacterium]